MIKGLDRYLTTPPEEVEECEETVEVREILDSLNIPHSSTESICAIVEELALHRKVAIQKADGFRQYADVLKKQYEIRDERLKNWASFMAIDSVGANAVDMAFAQYQEERAMCDALAGELEKAQSSAALFRDLLERIHVSSEEDAGRVSDRLIEAIGMALEDASGSAFLSAFNQMRSALTVAISLYDCGVGTMDREGGLEVMQENVTEAVRLKGQIDAAIEAADKILQK